MAINRKELGHLLPVSEEDDERLIKEEKKECSKRYDAQKYLDNKEKILEQNHQWYEENKEKVQNHSLNYYEKYKEKINKKQAEYRQTKKGKVVEKKAHHRRRRDLGFIPLNEPFEGSQYHHIDKEHVICIPEEMHRSVYHNVFTGQGMEEINKLAYDFLGLQLEAETVRQINEIQAQSWAEVN